MSYINGDGYIACTGDGFNNFIRFGSEKENYAYHSPLLARVHRNTKNAYSETPCGAPIFGDEYSLFRSRSASLSSTGSARSCGTVCESDVSERARSVRSTEPPSRVLSPLESSRNERVPDQSEQRKNWKPLLTNTSSRQATSKSHIDEQQNQDTAAEDSTASKPITNSSDQNQRVRRRRSGYCENDVSKTSTVDSRSKPVAMAKRQQRLAKNPGIKMEGGGSSRPEPEDDEQSVSTVSGSGIDFFRKFVQRKTSSTNQTVESCRECQDQFRREVLIDRLVSDCLNTRAAHSVKSSKGSNASGDENVSLGDPSLPDATTAAPDQTCRHHRCQRHQQQDSSAATEDNHSLSNTSSVSRVSSVSGTGLLFLKNYLKRKKSLSSRLGNNLAAAASVRKPGTTGGAGQCQSGSTSNISFFNSTPLPFPPPADHYGPVFVDQSMGVDDEDYDIEDFEEDDDYEDAEHGRGRNPLRRLSLCSTVADLLNEDFDCDDSELKNLDWEEWDEPLAEEMSYDDLVSVISETFYSEELDLGDLCDLDIDDGRKTVVANEKDNVARTAPPSSASSGENFSNKGQQLLISSPEEHSSTSTPLQPPAPSTKAQAKLSVGSNSSKTGANSVRPEGDRKPRYDSYKSTSFLQDLEAELELPPMTPVSDEKEEAVRAISRTISKYMRTKSDESYSSSNNSSHSRNSRKNSTTNSDSKSNNRSGNISRQEEYGARTASRCSRLGREIIAMSAGSRRSSSIVSPTDSDYLPELSSGPSPAPRRPLSQLLLVGDAEQQVVDSCCSSSRPNSRLSPDPITSASAWVAGDRRSSSASKRSPSTILNSACRGGEFRSPPPPPTSSTPFTKQQIIDMLSLPNTDYSLNFEGQRSPSNASGSALPHLETRTRSSCGGRGADEKTKNANRDSLLCGMLNFSPAVSPGPPTSATQPPPTAGQRPGLLRHSSTNSSDSGCPLLEDKIPSLSPTPSSPRANIELLSSNRTKLANFWERSLGSNTAGSQSEMPAWLPGNSQGSNSSTPNSNNNLNYNNNHNSNKNSGNNDITPSPNTAFIIHASSPPAPRLGFQPVKSSYLSESCLGGNSSCNNNNSSSHDQRLAHFLDVTRRAAEVGRSGGRRHLHKQHRASTGSDCSEYHLERLHASSSTSPGQPQHHQSLTGRRRESYTEHFV